MIAVQTKVNMNKINTKIQYIFLTHFYNLHITQIT